MKKIILIGAILFCSYFSGSVSYATENENVTEYPLTEVQKKVSTIVTEEGEEIIVTIKKEPSFVRALGNGTYTVSTERRGSWKASYQVTVKGNEITSTKNASATAISGSFTSKSLKIDHSTQATYYLKRKVGTSSSNINVRAKIEGSKLNVSVLT